MSTQTPEAVQVLVTGVVQGVGFRPFIHRLALRYGLKGWIRNESGEVRIRVEGPGSSLAAFLHAIPEEAPPLARIDEVRVDPMEPQGLSEFLITESQGQPDRRQPVSPDVALCSSCERELLDPADRRYAYPFITCTDCGPRFTVIEAMPYDRERTSMRPFSQCEACLTEYRTPDNRRYHCETNSCPRCGPRVWIERPASLSERDGDSPHPEETRSTPDPIGVAAEALRAGKIVAVRGLGGFHLAVDATKDQAIRRLRLRKGREAKPLAVMVANLQDAARIGRVDAPEARLLSSPERPIVLLETVPNAPLAPSVAPGLDTVGVMTAYTPLHRLLLREVGRPLVMTSGNQTEEPIATGNQEARDRLGGIADLFLLHDREITARYDDSVVRSGKEGPVFLRRARGYAPLPLRLPLPAPEPLLAVGPHLKNTFTLVHGVDAYVSQHIGDMDNLETLEHFQASLGMFQRLFRIEPKVVVRDMHPGYLSTRLAEEMDLGEPLAVQHHHAHVAAVAAEHGVTDRVIGVAYDGTGYGDDGNVWGAEILVAELTSYDRVGRLRYTPLPGGDLAVRKPWRTLLGFAALEPEAKAVFGESLSRVPERERETAERQIRRQLNAPLASSMGRLFDAAAAALGIRQEAFYEGQAAMEMEALAGRRVGPALPFPVSEGQGGGWIMDPLPLLLDLAKRRTAGENLADLAAGFHDAVAETTAEVIQRVARSTGIGQVVLGGGVFQNARLLHSIASRLSALRFRVLMPRALSPNDGCISFGQAAVAAAVLQSKGG